MSWTSISTAPPETDSQHSSASDEPGCWTVPVRACAPRSGGLHLYFAGSDQHNGHLAGQHVDFRSAGGYILAPPSRVNGRPYRLLKTLDGQGGLDWAAVTGLAATTATAGQTGIPPGHGR